MADELTMRGLFERLIAWEPLSRDELAPLRNIVDQAWQAAIVEETCPQCKRVADGTCEPIGDDGWCPGFTSEEGRVHDG